MSWLLRRSHTFYQCVLFSPSLPSPWAGGMGNERKHLSISYSSPLLMLLIGREWQLSAFSFKPALHLEGCVFLRKCLTLPMQVSNNTFWETVCYLFFVLRTSPWSSSMSPTLSAQKMKFHLPKLQVSLPCSTPPSSRYSFCRMCSTCFSPDFFKYSFV